MKKKKKKKISKNVFQMIFQKTDFEVFSYVWSFTDFLKQAL